MKMNFRMFSVCKVMQDFQVIVFENVFESHKYFQEGSKLGGRKEGSLQMKSS